MNKTDRDRTGGRYRPLTDRDEETIIREALRVLEKGGVKVFSDTAFEAFKKRGARVDEESRVVKLPSSMVEDSIASNPSEVVLCDRGDDTYSARLGGPRVHFGTGGTAIYVLDPDTEKRRQSLVTDVALNAHLTERLPYIDVFTINVFPNEIENIHHIDINRFYHSLMNTKKHIMGGLYSLEGCKKVIRMAELIAGNAEALEKRPFVSFITLIISPFKIDNIYGEMTCHIAKRGLPVVVPTEPVCGTTSPITLASNVLTHLAETLAGITLVQSIRRGAPGICGNVGSVTNLKTMAHLGGAVERGIIGAAVAQLTRKLNLPLYSTGGTSDSALPDIQSAYEGTMSNLLVSLAGANYIHDSAGLMESDLTVSYRKLIMDNEILGMCRRALRGVEVNADTLAADLIIETGPGGDFLGAEHTVEHMREEFFQPEIADRGESGAAEERISALLKRYRGEEMGTCLSKEQRETITKMFPEIRS